MNWAAPVDSHAQAGVSDRWKTPGQPRPRAGRSSAVGCSPRVTRLCFLRLSGRLPAAADAAAPTQAANLPAPGRPRPPGPPWSVDRRRPRPGSSTSGSARPSRARQRRAAAISSRHRRALHRHQRPVRGHQRHRPPEQPLQRGHRPGGHDVERPRAVQRLGPAADHLDVVEPELGDDLLEERGPRSSGSTRVTAQVGPGDRQHQPGQAGARARCRTPSRPSGTSLGQHRAVEQVPLPQPRRLPRADQPAHHARRWPAARRTARPAAAARTGTPSAPRRARRVFHVKRRPWRAGSRRAGSPRSGAARRPRTPRSGRPRRPRRGRPCARTASSGPATPRSPVSLTSAIDVLGQRHQARSRCSAR